FAQTQGMSRNTRYPPLKRLYIYVNISAHVRVTRLQFVMACLLLLAVVVVFVAPSVDLDPTTLGSQQAAVMALAGLVAAGTAPVALLVPSFAVWHGCSFETPVLYLSGLLDLICIRLC
ncbi:MAG TPA: hypothetical protein VLC12_02405, partial [Terriglobales bacterium]|nr:hypothetical protein [Terriglobales bacterium]